jgi:hypothetical protein
MRCKAAGAMANKRSIGMTVHRALAVVNAITGGGRLTTASMVGKPVTLPSLAVTSTLKVMLLAYSCAERIDHARRLISGHPSSTLRSAAFRWSIRERLQILTIPRVRQLLVGVQTATETCLRRADLFRRATGKVVPPSGAVAFSADA